MLEPARESQSLIKFSHLDEQVNNILRAESLRKRERQSVEKILKKMPKSFRAKARLLLKHLIDKAVPARITWDEEGIATIDGNVIKDSNIAELINDAMRERKIVKAIRRGQFSRLLRQIPRLYSGNKELLATTFVKILSPRASSTPKILRKLSTATTRKRVRRTRKGQKRKTEKEERAKCALFLSPRFRKDISITFTKDSRQARKRRLLDWSELK
ncbi:hypothetical protein P5V15_014373 [Pogonomyrmex californicus]